MEKPVRSSFQNLSISYECALAIGNSLNLSEMLHEVIHTMVHKTNAHRGIIWVKNGEQELQPVASAGINIKDVLAQGEIKDLRDVLKQIQKSRQFVFRLKNDKDFLQYCPVLTGKEESVLIVPVVNVAILHLIYAGTEIADEPLSNLLAGLSKKLSIAIEACLAHENIINEVQVREKAEKKLTKKTEQLISSEKKLQGLYGESERARKLLLSILEDITQKEEALRKTTKLLKSVMDNATDEAIITTDRMGIILIWNEGARRLLGYESKEVVDRESIRIFHTKEYLKSGIMDVNIKKMIATGKSLTEELDYITKEGKIIYVQEIVSPRFDEKGKFMGLVGMARDITEHKKAEEQIRFLSSVVEQSADGMAISDMEGNLLFVNDTWVRMHGYEKAEELIGQNLSIFHNEEQLKDDVEAFNRKVKEKGYNTGGVGHMRRDRTIFPTQMTSTLLRDENNIPIAIAGVATDISERKRAEEEKAKLEKQLRRSQKLETIGTLVAGIAHDFNNILTPILGYADLALVSLSSSNPLYKDLEHILKGANRAKDLVKQILLFSKQVEKERKPLSLHLIVKEVIELLRPSIPTTIEIRRRIDVSCDKVLADATQIHQVILNLCTNAWQAMEEKGGLLTIELKQIRIDAATAKFHLNLNEAEYVRITVIDTGIGMDMATQERIFEPFFTTKSVDKGTGMGLSVVHGIVRSHHGDIFVYSEPGKGSTFHVYIPVVKAEVEAETEQIEPEAMVEGQEYILVVDDEEAITNMMKRMLELLGYKVDVYNKSPEVLKVIRQHPDKYDLLISDLTMPNMTGLDLSEMLQKLCLRLPIIIMTGYGDSLTIATQKQYGIKQVIKKPILMRELATAIREVLDSDYINNFTGKY